MAYSIISYKKVSILNFKGKLALYPIRLVTVTKPPQVPKEPVYTSPLFSTEKVLLQWLIDSSFILVDLSD